MQSDKSEGSNNPVINPEFIKYVNKDGLDLNMAKIFAFAIMYECLDSFYIIGKDQYKFYICSLANRDPETQQLSLRVPLFTDKLDNKVNSIVLFKKFMKELENQGLTSRGIETNLTEFIIFGKNDKSLFNELLIEIQDLDIVKLARVIVDFYTNTKFPSLLANFLAYGAKIDYGKQPIIKFDQY